MLVLKINGLGSAMLGDQCHKPKPKRRRKRSEREVPRILYHFTQFELSLSQGS